MPRIMYLEGISFFIYYKDHTPPHVHVYYGEDSAVFQIDPVEKLEGSLPSKKEKVATRIIQENKELFLSKWKEFQG